MVIKTTKIRRTVTRVCEVLTDLHFNEPVHLYAAEVPEANGDVLDLRTFSGDTTVILKKWSFMEVGEKGWLEVKGVLKDGSPHTVHLMTGEPITADEVENGLSRVLAREALQKFSDGSELIIVFRTSVNACAEEGPVIAFPELRLHLKLYCYQDLTNFDDRTLGLWIPGTGVVDPEDITFEHLDIGPDGNPGVAMCNNTHTNYSNGTILQRLFNDLESGYTYQFSASVRRRNVGQSSPKLSLRKDRIEQVAVLELTDFDWHTLSFTFVMGADPILLDIYSHEASGVGNDWYTENLLVESV